MKTILAIAVVTCLFVVGLAQVPSQECMNQAQDLASCISSVSSGGDNFCSSCADRLIRYYRECANGVGVDVVQRRKLHDFQHSYEISVLTITNTKNPFSSPIFALI